MKKHIAPRVFYPALAIIGGAVLLTAVFPESAGKFLSKAQSAVVNTFGWYYVLIVAIFVVFALWMGLSRFGDIVLGKDDEKPEFSLMAWFAMLFAAGMGIGLVFWGAAEPLVHYDSPPPGSPGFGATDASGHGEEGIGSAGEGLAEAAIAQTYLHWGVHAWAIYVVVGLALAYAINRKGRPVSIRWALEPLFGNRVKGWIGDVIDVVAIVGTLFGVATSLGFGVKQIAAGLDSLGWIPNTDNGVLVIIISVITLVATISVVTGLGKGIKWLSNTNLVLAGIFVVALLILGPTLFLFKNFVQSLGVYFQNIVSLTFNDSAFQEEAGEAWQASWTTFYWGWWISWAPFVGVFIARISRGRTVRQFVAGVLIVPTLVTFIWFSILGGSSLYRQLFGSGGLVDRSQEASTDRVASDTVLFDLLGGMNFGTLLSIIVIVLVSVFFVTSSDSGSLVVDMLASGGNPNPPVWSRVLFAILEGAVAITLLLVTVEGNPTAGLAALQTAAVMTALPFSVIMLLMCVATYKALSIEHNALLRAENRARRRELTKSVRTSVTKDLTGNFDEHFAEPVDQRIEHAFDQAGISTSTNGSVSEGSEKGADRASDTPGKSS